MCDCKEKKVPSNELLKASLSIPDEIREDFADVVDRTRNTVTFRDPDLAYIFEVYNRYIAPAGQAEDRNCHGCRAKVIGKVRRMVLLWREGDYLGTA